MADKPKRASEYSSEQVELVRATCLYIATKLGDMMEDLVIVGGLVPSLIVDQTTLPQDIDAHVGTMDLDFGLQLALLDEGRYRKLTERLRDAGFAMDKNDDGNPTRQRWTITSSGTVTVDFLIPPSREGDRPGKLRDIEPDFAAIIAPGLRCAFRDRQHVTIQGHTLFGEKAERDVWVCGAGAYVVLKALAFDSRGENKDAYDLFYVARNYGAGVDDVVAKLKPLLDDSRLDLILEESTWSSSTSSIRAGFTAYSAEALGRRSAGLLSESQESPPPENQCNAPYFRCYPGRAPRLDLSYR